jgi:hypothetical protein
LFFLNIWVRFPKTQIDPEFGASGGILPGVEEI